ncbi:MAG: alpha/beta hydrolase-fold protein [Saprospiraceae bacterium]
MKQLHVIGFILLLFIWGSQLAAQTILSDSLYFEATNSYRTYKVWLPADYDSSQQYQTIYCLDASLLFNALCANVEVYADPSVGKLPPSIVIGLYFDQRNDDMGILWNESALDPTGQAFKSFIENKLIPTIETRFSVSPYRSIVGHSNSSTYIQFFLWDKHPAFQGYLAMSMFALKKDTERFCALQVDPAHPIDLVYVSAKNDAEFRFNSGTVLENLLDSCTHNGLRSRHLIFEHADHISMALQGMPLGLETLYKDFAYQPIPSDSLLESVSIQGSPLKVIDSLVRGRSAKYGTLPKYTFDDLNALYDLYVLQKDSIHISVATQKYVELFPEDSDHHFYEAQHLEMMGAYYSAEKQYLMHLQTYSDPGYWAHMRLIWLYSGPLKKPQEAIHWCLVAYKKLGSIEFLDQVVKLCSKYPALRDKAIADLEATGSSKEIKSYLERLQAIKKE